MTNSDHDQPPLPIQQRLALERRKNYAIYQICFTALFAVAWTVINLVGEAEPFRWVIAGVFAVLAIASVFSLRSALRALRAFDAQRAVGTRHPTSTSTSTSTSTRTDAGIGVDAESEAGDPKPLG